MPVGAARRHCESGRHGEQERALLGQLAIELREAQVVTDAEADAAHVGIGHHRRITARHGVGLAIGFARGELHIEQMNLVVARGNAAVGRE